MIGTKLLKYLRLLHYNVRDREAINEIALCYILGMMPYREASTRISEYKLQAELSQFLNSFDYSQVQYILKPVRYYAKNWGRRNKEFPHPAMGLPKNGDIKIVAKLADRVDLKKIRPIKKVVSEEELLVSLTPMIRNKAKSLFYHMKSDSGFGKEDLASELTLRAMAAYRIYVFNCGCNGFTEEELKACMIKSVSTRKVDMLTGHITRSKFRSKLSLEDVEDGKGVKSRPIHYALESPPSSFDIESKDLFTFFTKGSPTGGI
jgi:hypothetical protein